MQTELEIVLGRCELKDLGSSKEVLDMSSEGIEMMYMRGERASEMVASGVIGMIQQMIFVF